MKHKITRIKFRSSFNIIIYFTDENSKSLFRNSFNLGMGFPTQIAHHTSTFLH